MKKLIFGMAFMGAMMCTGGKLMAQVEEEEGEGEDQWVCCLEPGEYCQDWLGGAWSDSIEKPGPFCP